MNSSGKVEEDFMELVTRNIEKYRDFLVEIGKL